MSAIPAAPFMLAEPPSEPERLRSCIAAIAGRLSAATSPTILVDADADRFGVASELMELAQKMQVPVAVINAAKAVIDGTFPKRGRPCWRSQDVTLCLRPTQPLA